VFQLIGHRFIPSLNSGPRKNLPYKALASFDKNQVVVIWMIDENCGFCKEYCVKIA
jgi:hypothetical protein